MQQQFHWLQRMLPLQTHTLALAAAYVVPAAGADTAYGAASDSSLSAASAADHGESQGWLSYMFLYSCWFI